MAIWSAWRGEKKFVKGLDIQQGWRMIRGVGSALGAF